ncbi:hypothetical protein [Streptomyces echinoruber]|nr:hypothetical protein [Streptomyces echinoruber]
MDAEVGAQAARTRALAVLRVRSRALAAALLPAAVAVVLLAGGATGHLVGPGWDAARWAVTPVAALVLLAAAGVALVIARARPAVSPTVPVPEQSAPDLYRLVRDLADRLDVPAPSAIALTPDCDSWLEDRTHPAHGPPPPEEHAAPGIPTGPYGRDADTRSYGTGTGTVPGGRSRGHRWPPRRTDTAPVLVIGSPFLWWMRVGELRALLAPVVAGTGPSAHPDIAAARRFVRGLDAAVAVTAVTTRCPLTRSLCAALGRVVRLLLRGCREHAAEMERGVAAAAAERAQTVDYGLRIVAQEQVGLAYAGWDRLLTRVALPAWRMGRWPARLDAGVVAALTELSRRDRLAEGFASRLGERPACDLLEEPGAVDAAASLLAARLFHGGPAAPDRDWSPVDWDAYPEEVVDRKWRADAARLHRALDTVGARRAPATGAPTLARVLDHLTTADAPAPARDQDAGCGNTGESPAENAPSHSAESAAERAPAHPAESATASPAADTRAADEEHLHAPHDPADEGLRTPHDPADEGLRAPGGLDDEDLPRLTPRGETLAAALSAAQAREEVAARTGPAAPGTPAASASTSTTPAAPTPVSAADIPDTALYDDRALPLFPLQPPRSARELLADHVTAMVCCAAVDTAGAAPGLDWLDGPVLLVHGERAPDLTPHVLHLIEHGDPAPLRSCIADLGIRADKPVRLV